MLGERGYTNVWLIQHIDKFCGFAVVILARLRSVSSVREDQDIWCSFIVISIVNAGVAMVAANLTYLGISFFYFTLHSQTQIILFLTITITYRILSKYIYHITTSH